MRCYFIHINKEAAREWKKRVSLKNRPFPAFVYYITSMANCEERNILIRFSSCSNSPPTSPPPNYFHLQLPVPNRVQRDHINNVRETAKGLMGDVMMSSQTTPTDHVIHAFVCLSSSGHQQWCRLGAHKASDNQILIQKCRCPWL